MTVTLRREPEITSHAALVSRRLATVHGVRVIDTDLAEDGETPGVWIAAHSVLAAEFAKLALETEFVPEVSWDNWTERNGELELCVLAGRDL